MSAGLVATRSPGKSGAPRGASTDQALPPPSPHCRSLEPQDLPLSGTPSLSPMATLAGLPDEPLANIIDCLEPTWRGLFRQTNGRARRAVKAGEEKARVRGAEYPTALSLRKLSSRPALLEWATRSGLPEDNRTRKLVMKLAAEGGHLESLRWGAENEWPLDAETCGQAAKHGQEDVLCWLRGNQIPWDKSTCASAAEGGHLALLQWARREGCPWDSSKCESAARGGASCGPAVGEAGRLPMGQNHVCVGGQGGAS